MRPHPGPIDDRVTPRLQATVRIGAVVLLTTVLLPVTAGTAAAHGAGALGPTPRVPRIISVVPPVPGLTVTIIEAGARVRIDNGTGATVEVVPAGPTREVEPVVSPGRTARWHDPRIDAAALPVLTDGARTWTVPLLVGGREVAVQGEQVFPPPPPTGLWWLATAVAAAAAALAGTVAATRRWAALTTAAVTALVLAAHVVHVLGVALVPDDQDYLPVVLGTAGIGLVAWLAPAAGVALTVSRHPFGLLLCGLAAAVLAMVTAFGTVGFSFAVLPFGWSPDLARLTTVLTVGAGAGLFVTGLVALRTMTPAPVDDRTGRV